MKVLVKLIIGFIIASLFSCGSHRIYTTGTYASIKSYTEKPVYHDRTESAIYVSADGSFGSHPQDDESFKDSKTLLSLNVHRSHTHKFINYYYGLGGTMGRYKFKRGYQDLVTEGETQNFYNVNAKTGINFTYVRPKINYRILGVEFTYFSESGEYQDKLDYLTENNDGGLDIINKPNLFSYNIYSEYVLKGKDNNAIILGVYIGDVFIDKSLITVGDTSTYSGFLLGVQLSDFTISGVFEDGSGGINSVKLGLTYKITGNINDQHKTKEKEITSKSIQ